MFLTVGRTKVVNVAVVLLASSPSHPVTSQSSGHEVQRVSQVILHFGDVCMCVCVCVYVYTYIYINICVYIHMPLLTWSRRFSSIAENNPQLSRPILLSAILNLEFLFFFFIIPTITCWTIQLKKQDVSDRTYQINIDISSVKGVFSCLFNTHVLFFFSFSFGITVLLFSYLLKMIIKVYCEICIKICGL